MSDKIRKIDKIVNWIKDSLGNVISIILSISSLIGIGYAAGSYKSELDCKLEQIKLNQEYNEKLINSKRECDDIKSEFYKATAEDLKKVVTELQKKDDGKKR